MEQTVLAPVDWWVIAAMLGASLLVGFLVKDQASEGGVEGFFTAGRKMKWWLLGTSIVATTFASDTPLAITGWIARYGIAGNWFWWGGVLGSVAMTVFFARKWRTSGVVTDVEITELRYGGPAAATLRSVKAFINATLVNCVILGWVFAGMSKISESFMDWQWLLGSGLYGAMEAAYPEALLFGSFDNTLTIAVLVVVTLAYSALGGMRAVIITDLVQFALAMCMSVLLTVLAVSHLGGLEAMWDGLAAIYPSDGSATSLDGTPYLTHERVAAFVPDFGDGVVGSLGIPFSAFVLTLGVMWWTSGTVDGSGFTAQRLYTARDGGEAEKGALWYSFANFMLRSWPWAIAGVAALVIFPRPDVDLAARQFTECLHQEQACTLEMRECLENRYACSVPEYALLYRDEGQLSRDGLSAAAVAAEDEATVVVFREDRERSYPAMIRELLPAGLMGLMLASLMAAFMSTVSTHINWGASYLANDFYYRFINPRASEQHLTTVSRLATLVIALMAIVVASTVDNIGSMWELYGGMMAGLGLPHLMRWLWWRANAWTEISGMLTGFVLALANYIAGQNALLPDGQISIFPAFMASHAVHVICWISLVSALASVVATLVTAPVEAAQLRRFVARTRPMGFWREYAEGYAPERSFRESLWYFALGGSSIYAGMFGVGYLLRLQYAQGIGLLLLCSVALAWMVRGMGRIDRGVAAP
ncbi:Na+:solute symporter [Pseudohalioglobus sediminis]|uniref:Na+:solute symporter n=1 Tax=Pseudohalioglobus sediminis TaxID=2606449 RepID=A0A5B0WN22_9GAMM|nr:sodium:solute symporter family protein [Pseudohalioglobus sediminis]KAA1188454.1 Na+:solute symporter [Pseudohalioglobus sediminis]